MRSTGHPQVRAPRPPAARGGRRLPRPRLTGLGGGLFACVAMLLAAGISWLLFDSSLFAYGLLFLPVAAATAAWVRPADLITAPVAVPIAFAAGVWPVSGGSGGVGGQLMGVVSALSLHAGWLYAGTLVAALIALVRRAALSGRRRAARRSSTA
ncbi:MULTISPECIES: DUF6542 domain-containing protein [Streptomyces]|uniref:DUF6542 domain-containing protein n=1 Tax=Streptomyces TaxID=1883 RepID=UPI0024751EAF|nr:MULTISPECIES: DUF6542 domain-containing protein [Streptomyces]MDH6540812.1 hypothetical protein [Streptomyces sp. SPB4]